MQSKFNEDLDKRICKSADECGITNTTQLIIARVIKTHLITEWANKINLITVPINKTHLITARMNKVRVLTAPQ